MDILTIIVKKTLNFLHSTARIDFQVTTVPCANQEVRFYGSYSDFCKETDVFLTRLNDTKWLRHSSKMLELTGKIVNCMTVCKQNVFLEERRHNTDSSCIITSLVKICLNAKYRTIVGLENLIQKEWFLAGHKFLTRLNTSVGSNKASGGNEYAAAEPNRKSSASSGNLLGNTDIGNLPGTTDNASSGTSSSKSKEEFAPTFLLFLDCLFQLTTQCPNEFEYNEHYLIHLWDYSISGLSLTYGFDGISGWFRKLNDQTFSTASDLPIDSFSSVNMISPGMPIISSNKYLQELFDSNVAFWQGHLTKNATLLVNKNFSGNNNNNNNNLTAVINPCDKMYMLKFWSRCYLRWIERYHSYNNTNNNSSSIVDDKSREVFAQDVIAPATLPTAVREPPPPPSPSLQTKNTQQREQADELFRPRKAPPPPVPPKPAKPVTLITADMPVQTVVIDKTNEEVDAESSGNVKPGIVINPVNENRLKIVTRVTPDGNIESTF